MKVILQQDVKGQGRAGDLIEVSDGYARNYLLPRKLALEATADSLNSLKIQEQAKKRKADLEKQKAVELAAKLSSLPVKVKAKAGETGRLYGSVTAKEISESLKEQHGIDIDKHKIMLDDPIRSFGTYELKAKLYPEVSGTIYLVVAEN